MATGQHMVNGQATSFTGQGMVKAQRHHSRQVGHSSTNGQWSRHIITGQGMVKAQGHHSRHVGHSSTHGQWSRHIITGQGMVKAQNHHSRHVATGQHMVNGQGTSSLVKEWMDGWMVMV